jgi:transcription elongation GreA/GreB family factor
MEFKILGAWDSAPEQRIISYKTAIGQALLGKKIGHATELPTETASRQVEIVNIEACAIPESRALQAVS